MRPTERLLDQLNRSFGGEAWHGPALRNLLDGVTDEQAKSHPVRGAHSILELVVHVGNWNDAIDRLEGRGREARARSEPAVRCRGALGHRGVGAAGCRDEAVEIQRDRRRPSARGLSFGPDRFAEEGAVNADDFRTLYAYNTWANRRVLEACRALDPSTFSRPTSGSFGSIKETLSHIAWAEWLWLERWQHRSPKKASLPEASDLPSIERIMGETAYELGPLPVPAMDGLTPELARGTSAIELLLDRAPGLDLTVRDEVLGGLPQGTRGLRI